jgi:putative ABC transport system permease protein
LGTTADMQRVRRLRIASGQYLSPGDPNQGGSEVVLGIKVAEELFGSDNPLGGVVRIGQWRFRVVGVLAPRGRSLGFDFDDVVMIPVGTAMRMFNRSSLFRILVEVNAAEDLEAGKQAVLRLLEGRHRAEDVTVITQIASISLTVAGVGIMNVMLVAVAERRQEIGLLRAIGASTGQLLGVFVTEAAVLSTVGGVVGLIMGWAAVRGFVRFYPTFPASPPLWAVVSSLAVALVVGVVFGVVPARRAARLDPVVALVGR